MCVLIVLFVLFLFVILICLIYKCSKSGTLDLQPDLGKPSRPSQAKPAAWGAIRSVPDHVTKREYGAVYF